MSFDVTGDIQIDLYKGGTAPGDFVVQLAANAPNTGSYPFNPPDYLADGSDYLIGISADGGTVWDFSRGFFTITRESVDQYPVSNPGFETFESTCSEWPTTFADWTGDYSQIVTSENGINPQEGSQMLRFISAWFRPGILPELKASQIFQLVDTLFFKSHNKVNF